MNAPPRSGFIGWLKRIECRLDAWAATKLSAEEYADAVALDQQLKRDWWRWLGVFALVVVFFGLVLVSIWPQLGWVRPFVFSLVGCAYILLGITSAWYGYRKYTGKPAWKVFLLFIALLLGGAATGFVVANLNMGRPLMQVTPEKLAQGVATALLLGILLAALLVGVSRMRLREATQRAARLQADAERERLARQGVQAELKLLQAQVEPHFLFNTLANVRYLVESKSPDALTMLDHLIHYLRTALPEIRSESSTLGREAELARAYLEVIRMRMGGGLDISVDVPENLAGVPFPPLMLMTLVENAIKHGVAPRGRGRVAVRASLHSRALRISVTDDGRGLAEPIGQGVGLANIRERLRALHADEAHLDLASREGGGTVATIEVPA